MAIESHDFVSTSPTNVFPTFSPIHFSEDSTPDIATLSDGNLVATVSSSTCAFSNFQIPKTGKWFIEVLLATDSYPQFGIGNVNAVGQGSSTGYYGIYNNGSSIILHNGSHTTPASSGAWSPDDVNEVGLIAIDSDNNKIWLGVNTNASAGASSGLYIGNSTSAAFDDNYPTIGTNGYNTAFDINDGWFINVSGGGSSVWVLNCGQDPTFGGRRTGGNPSSGDGSIGLFHTVPPTGFKALCTANIQSSLAIDPAVDDLPEDFFKCVGYVGNGGTTTISSLTFQPDFVWIKNRDSANHSNLFDSVRGVQKALYSGTTQAESTDSTTLTTFSSNGFAVSSNVGVNENTKKHIAWCWKAGGAPTADYASGNDTTANGCFYKDGSAVTTSNAFSGSYTITPTRASIGTKQGFSIIKYSSVSATPKPTKLPHGLGKKPEFIITKCLDTASTSWVTVQTILDSDFYLNGTDAKFQASGTYFQITADANTITFAKTDSAYSNNGTKAYIVYAFTSISGYSAFGSVANLNNDEFVYLGFKPAWIMFKRTTDTSNWTIYDNARNPHNVCDKLLNADTANAESTYSSLDLLSNGFKARSFSGASGEWVYMAFAEMPFKYSATNAR